MSSVDHDQSRHQFTTDVDGHRAVLDYTLTGSVMTITHTAVPPVIGGRGVAASLMQAALSAAREENWTVNPICSYAVAYMQKHANDDSGGAGQRHLDALLDEALDESYPASDSPSVGGSN
jgi:predicted GNAT family acetyltransferase